MGLRLRWAERKRTARATFLATVFQIDVSIHLICGGPMNISASVESQDASGILPAPPDPSFLVSYFVVLSG
ncbi:MAG: hypothetical protein IPJ88_18050 [Myxococcales bacterium]|nr:MAG: hypothetical protein IPJ88_18050 [Myxococcales bacterium]